MRREPVAYKQGTVPPGDHVGVDESSHKVVREDAVNQPDQCEVVSKQTQTQTAAIDPDECRPEDDSFERKGVANSPLRSKPGHVGSAPAKNLA
jgi:hypothetical protein